jgi:hypothetical protein
MNAQKIQVQFQHGRNTVRASVAHRDGKATYVVVMWFSDTQEPFHSSFCGYVNAYRKAMAVAQLQLIH